MKRKPPYKPLVHNEGIFTEDPKIVEVHGPALDYKDKEALIFPDKVKNNAKWGLTLSSQGFFKKENGREIDVYDDIRSKYFNSDARGIGTISTFVKNTKRAVS
jgi:hypothetical protein